MPSKLEVEYWADYICPWCYLALDRVDDLVEQHGAVVRWRPFELHPEIPPEGAPHPAMSRSDDATSYLRTELAAAGIVVRRRDTWSNSLRALALSQWARDRPQWPRLHRSLYAAYWAEGRNIGDPAVLREIAAGAGLPPDAVAEALATGSGREDVVAAKHEALDLGIGATPGWRFAGSVVLSGAHPRSVFDRVVSRLPDHGDDPT